MTEGARRAGTIGVIVAVLLVAAGVDQLVSAPAPRAQVVAVQRTPREVASASAISSSWYCAAGLSPTPTARGTAATTTSTAATTTTAPAAATATTKASPLGSTSSTSGRKLRRSAAKKPAARAPSVSLLLANSGSHPVRGSVTTVSPSGARAAMAITVPARGQMVVDESRLAPGPDTAATVALDGGAVAVEQRVTTATMGTAVAPCASRPTRAWYFASGSTAGGDRLLVSLYNPLASPAIADLSFVTGEGQLRPSDDQGIVVPGESQVVLDVGAHVQERSLVATTVTVRLGRVVADEVEMGSARPDLALTLGAAAPRTRWYFPAGLVVPGAHERLDIVNPSADAAQVEIGLALSSGGAEPLHVTVAPGGILQVEADKQHRIPVGVLFGAVVRSTNGVAVVAERSIVDSPPDHQRGLGDTVGGLPARRWLLAAGPPAGSSQVVIVENPGAAPVRVSVAVLDRGPAGPVPGLSDLVVPPGRPLLLPLGAFLHGSEPQLPLAVTAGAPIVVEQDVIGPGGRGVSTVLAEPAP
ncbi:MAG: DUF5719 family protein [Acidimicrobiales bacterium]